MSGADVSYHQVITHPMLAYNNTIKLGRMVGCSQLNGQAVFECLLTRSTNDIIAGTRDMLVRKNDSKIDETCHVLFRLNLLQVEFNRFAFLPTVDKVFLPDPPLVMLKQKKVASPLTYLTGVNTQDGTEVLRKFVKNFHVFLKFLLVSQSKTNFL